MWVIIEDFPLIIFIKKETFCTISIFSHCESGWLPLWFNYFWIPIYKYRHYYVNYFLAAWRLDILCEYPVFSCYKSFNEFLMYKCKFFSIYASLSYEIFIIEQSFWLLSVFNNCTFHKTRITKVKCWNLNFQCSSKFKMTAYHKVSYYQYYIYINCNFFKQQLGHGEGNYYIVGCVLMFWIEDILPFKSPSMGWPHLDDQSQLFAWIRTAYHSSFREPLCPKTTNHRVRSIFIVSSLCQEREFLFLEVVVANWILNRVVIKNIVVLFSVTPVRQKLLQKIIKWMLRISLKLSNSDQLSNL